MFFYCHSDLEGLFFFMFKIWCLSLSFVSSIILCMLLGAQSTADLSRGGDALLWQEARGLEVRLLHGQSWNPGGGLCHYLWYRCLPLFWSLWKLVFGILSFIPLTAAYRRGSENAWGEERVSEQRGTSATWCIVSSAALFCLMLC